ncbi:unnamed protein product [Staurois parvus]|uniref:Uncharacterized protein n=1 Tax=Staurois parvus TaxID=386267 RepID=A0ABN9DHE8_9NEOB|nr:unnamed protein product [Staurois parvus]
MARREQCRGGWLFINSLPAPCLCALPGSTQHRDLVPAVSLRTQWNTDRHTGPLGEVPIM